MLRLAPLPPLLPANAANAVGAELLRQERCCSREIRLGDVNLVDFDPLWVRDPLAGEGLQFLDRVTGGMLEKRADEMKAFVI